MCLPVIIVVVWETKYSVSIGSDLIRHNLGGCGGPDIIGIIVGCG